MPVDAMWLWSMVAVAMSVRACIGACPQRPVLPDVRVVSWWVAAMVGSEVRMRAAAGPSMCPWRRRTAFERCELVGNGTISRRRRSTNARGLGLAGPAEGAGVSR